jgi:hypothetical protein
LQKHVLIGGLEHEFYFPIYWEEPSQLTHFSDGLKPPTSVSLGFLEQALGTTFTVRALSRIDFGVFSKHLKPQGEQEEALACKVGEFLKKIRAKKPQQPAKEEDIAPEKEIVEAAHKKQKIAQPASSAAPLQDHDSEHSSDMEHDLGTEEGCSFIAATYDKKERASVRPLAAHFVSTL